MSSQVTRGRMREQSLRAVVTRADGRREELGVISYWHRNPLKRWAWKAGRMLRRLRNWRS